MVGGHPIARRTMLRWMAGMAAAAALFGWGAAAEAAEGNEKSKKRKKKSGEIQYQHVVGANVLSIGPYSVQTEVDGRRVEGRVSLGIETKDVAAKGRLQDAKQAIHGIVYPLALRLYERGRPTQQGILEFKAQTLEKLTARFGDSVVDVYIKDML